MTASSTTLAAFPCAAQTVGSSTTRSIALLAAARAIVLTEHETILVWVVPISWCRWVAACVRSRNAMTASPQFRIVPRAASASLSVGS